MDMERDTGEMKKRAEKFGRAWLGLCSALALHVFDEALTGFLPIYNRTVIELRRRRPYIPAPTFELTEWLLGLVAINTALFCMTPLAFRNNRMTRRLGYPLMVIMFANGVGHVAATIAGRTVRSVRFARPMPGFWSSPLLIGASAYMAYETWKIRGETDA
jgi:hypothetical protein